MQTMRDSGTSSPVRNALTVDVEDYYHVSAFEARIKRTDWDQFESRVANNTLRLLDLLGARGVQATFFVLGWVADRYPWLVQRIHTAGHEIGCHSYWHRLVYQQTPQAFRTDLRRARDTLQEITGEAVIAYRAPSFSITQHSLWALDILIEEGFGIDSSIYPILHDRYGMPGVPCRPHRVNRPVGSVCEFPLPVYGCLGFPVPVGGGGYFRFFPYAFTRNALSSINQAGLPFVFYLHPWELDPDQPRLKAGLVSRFRHYCNLHRTEARLQALLGDFQMTTLSDCLAEALPDYQAARSYARAA
jgi:polysaccharide deacetylase family protein (PEP-CTERM system associated)